MTTVNTSSGKTSSKANKPLVHVPVSANLSADDEKKRLTYLKKIIMPSLWSHQSAAFLREASVVKPKEFTVDLVSIQTKFNKDKYSSSSEAFTDLKKLFDQSQKSRTADIKNAGKLMLDHYNDKIRAYETRFNGEEQDCDAESDDVSMEGLKEEIGQTCPVCTFLNDPTATGCQLCEAGLPRAKGAVAETVADSDRPEIPQKAPSDWNCPECTFTNSGQDRTCQVCETPRNIVDTLKKELDKCHNVISEIKKEKETNNVTYPSNWSVSLKQDTGLLRMVQLTKTDPDYTFVQEWTGTAFKQSGYEVKSVRRVENWEMYQVYAQKRIAMERRNGESFENEKWLFHGTSKDCIDNICRYGFNRSYAGKHGTAIGVGVYFAPHSTTSAGYSSGKNGTNKMLLCRVLTGRYTTGSSAFIEPPMRSKTERFDSVVDNIKAPRMFVVFSDYQAYPEFEIKFGYKSFGLLSR